MTEKPILFSGPMVRAIIDGRKTMTRRTIKKPAALDALATFGPSMLMQRGCADLLPIALGDLLWVKETFRIKSWDEDGAFWITYEADGETSGPLYPDDESYMEGVCDRLERAKVDTDPATGYYINIPRQLLSRPSIFMPKAFSRITLRVTAVKVERLQDISEEDAKAEGCFFTDYGRKCGHTAAGWQDVGDCPAPIEHHPQRPGWMWDKTTSSDFCLSSARFAFGNLWESINGLGSWHANPWVAAYSFERVK